MTITLYTNNSPKNKVGKSLTEINTLTGSLKSVVDVINPVFRIEDENISSLITSANYLYAEEFGRYYFITDFSIINEKIVDVICAVDILETAKNFIKEQTAVIERQENTFNTYLADPIFRTNQNPYTVLKEFPQGFSNVPSIVLSTF